MEKRYIVAPRTRTRLLVDEIDPEVAGAIQRRHDVVGRERDVVDPRTVPVEVVGDRPTLGRLQQLDVAGVTELEEHHPEPVERLLVSDRRIEERLEQFGERAGVVCRDPDVIEAHAGRSPRQIIKGNGGFEVMIYTASRKPPAMELSNTDGVAGREITETLGVVRGNTVRARNVGRDITQGLRNLAGGELKGYTELMTDARDQAQDRMVAEAEALDADAVVNVRFTTSSIADSGAEILAYGTAVRLD